MIGTQAWHSLPFSLATVGRPAPTFGKVCGEVAGAKVPPSSWIMYKPVPPPKVAVMEPSPAPLQVISIFDKSKAMAAFSVIVPVALF